VAEPVILLTPEVIAVSSRHLRCYDHTLTRLQWAGYVTALIACTRPELASGSASLRSGWRDGQLNRISATSRLRTAQGFRISTARALPLIPARFFPGPQTARGAGCLQALRPGSAV